MAKIVSKLDAMIREGKLDAVIKTMSEMNLAKVPRPERQGLAKICRRVGLIAQGLRLLHPIVRRKLPLAQKPTAGELCEYAVLLSRNGSIDEALALLDEIDDSELPEALLYRGFLHISNWDYAKALVYLDRFLGSGADAYMKMIARVNRNAALVETGQFAEAETAIAETIASAHASGAVRLAANGHELLAQVHIQRRDFQAARAALATALEIFKRSQVYDLILVEKWLAYIRAQESADTAPLVEFREKAAEHRHWPSVREADFLRLKIAFKHELFNQLYHGTPMTAYRERLRAQLPAEPARNFNWGAEPCFDLDDCRLDGRSLLKPGSQTHHVLLALTSDLYEPSNTGRLFGLLYPGEYFDIDSSPLRVRQALRRARQWFEDHDFNAHIIHEKSGYRLTLEGGFGFRLHLQNSTSDLQDQQTRQLKETFPPGRLFSMKEAIAVLGVSRSSFHRLADELKQSAQIATRGKGKSLRYEFIATGVRRAAA